MSNKKIDSIMVNAVDKKEQYRKLCKHRSDIPLFMQAWWMDAVCNSDKKYWDVFLVEFKGEIIGAMPYHLLTKYYFKIILLPLLTQYNGIWIKYPENQSNNQRFRFEKMIMTNIIDQINDSGISFFQQNFYHNITNWLPFYWLGFKQSTRYTYILKNISDTEKIFNNIHSFKQKHIKKAQRTLHVDFDMTPEEFYKFHSESLSLIKKTIFYSDILFKNIHTLATERQQGKIIAIRDNEDNIHSATFVVWDKESAYYLISAIHPEFKSSGASSLMVWEAILFLADKTKNFDFEGSMIESVAKTFEEFGAEQTPYFIISKSNYLFSTYMNL
jgi:hypothetical protein